jgi:DNA-binding CsgD family transcriptional regulator
MPDVSLLPGPPGQPRFMSGETGLTSREVEMLLLICKGLTIESIAEVSRISTHTVVAHMKSIYRKLKVHSRAEAAFEARQLGLM